MRTLVMIEKQELRDLLVFYLEARFGFQVRETKSFEQAARVMREEKGMFDFVVCDFIRGGRDLMRHVFNQFPPIHFICSTNKIPDLANTKVLKHWAHFINEGDWVGQADEQITSLFKEATRDNRPPELRYSRVKASLLLWASPLDVDLYMFKPPDRFVKVMDKGQLFEAKELQVFQVKHRVQHLFMKSDDVKVMAKRLQNNLLFMPKGKPGDAAKILEVGHSLEAIQETSFKLGFTKEVQEFTKANVMKAVSDIKRAPKLGELIAVLSRDKEKYIAAHSILLAHVACALATQMEWQSDTTYHKLTLAAFLHDITLKNQALAAIEGLRELRAKKELFTDDEIKEYREHPLKASEIAKSFDEIPADVDVILAQHHERPDGTGFPRGMIHTRINPMTAVFIVAHDLTRFIIEKSRDTEINGELLLEFVNLRKKTYQHSAFRKALMGIQNIKL